MDKINIVLSPPQQPYNQCAKGDSEQDHMYEIGREVYNRLLPDNRLNLFLIPKLTGGTNENLYKLVELSNDFILKNGGSGFHLALHSDGGYAGTGASGFYLSEAGRVFGLPIFQEISAFTPWQDMSFRQWSELYELRNTIAVASLLEVSFHDKVEEAQWIHNNTGAIADAVVRGLYKGISVEPYQASQADKPPYVTDLIPQGIQMQYFDDRLEVRLGNGPWKIVKFDS